MNPSGHPLQTVIEGGLLTASKKTGALGVVAEGMQHFVATGQVDDSRILAHGLLNRSRQIVQ